MPKSLEAQLDDAIDQYREQILWMRKCAGNRTITRANYITHYAEYQTSAVQAGEIFDADMEGLRRMEEVIDLKRAKILYRNSRVGPINYRNGVEVK